jgi:hypothetical protein
MKKFSILRIAIAIMFCLSIAYADHIVFVQPYSGVQSLVKKDEFAIHLGYMWEVRQNHEVGVKWNRVKLLETRYREKDYNNEWLWREDTWAFGYRYTMSWLYLNPSLFWGEFSNLKQDAYWPEGAIGDYYGLNAEIGVKYRWFGRLVTYFGGGLRVANLGYAGFANLGIGFDFGRLYE